MRLISQDGMIDVPYENVCVSINYRNKNQIIAWNFGCEDCEIEKMATYSTETKALKAMEMLRETYLSRMELEGGYDRVNGCYVQPNYWVLPKVFKFPADEEVEV